MVVFAFRLLANFASGEGPSCREVVCVWGGIETWRKDRQRDQRVSERSFCIYTRTLCVEYFLSVSSLAALFPSARSRRTEILFSNLFTQKSACSIINSPACLPRISSRLAPPPLNPPPSLGPPFHLLPSPLKPALSSHSQASSRSTHARILRTLCWIFLLLYWKSSPNAEV